MTNWLLVIAVVLGILLLLGAYQLILSPIRWALRLVLNAASGLALLYVFNLVAGVVGVHVGMNPVTAVTAGLLGIPGVLLLFGIQLVLGA